MPTQAHAVAYYTHIFLFASGDIVFTSQVVSSMRKWTSFFIFSDGKPRFTCPHLSKLTSWSPGWMISWFNWTCKWIQFAHNCSFGEEAFHVINVPICFWCSAVWAPGVPWGMGRASGRCVTAAVAATATPISSSVYKTLHHPLTTAHRNRHPSPQPSEGCQPHSTSPAMVHRVLRYLLSLALS